MKIGSLRKFHLMTKPCNFASQKVGVVFQRNQKKKKALQPTLRWKGSESNNEKGICSWSVCPCIGRRLPKLGGT